MKILITTGLYPPETGGPATYTFTLEKKLSRYDHTIKVIPFSQFKHLPKIIRHVAFFIHTYKKARDFDLIITTDPVSVGLPTAFASLYSGTPFILRLGGDYAWEQGTYRFGIIDHLDVFIKKTTKYPLMVLALKYIQMFVAKRAFYVLTPSHYLASIVEKWGISKEKIHIIYNAFEARDHGSLINKEKLGLKNNYPIIVSSGRLVPWKGFLEIVDVVSVLRHKYPSIKLIICGDGCERNRLQEKISKLKLENNVLLTGRVNHTLLFSYITAADVFCLNSEYEGLSHQLLEAMNCGTPIIATSTGGNLEVIQDSENGILIPINDVEELRNQIERLLSDKVLAKTLAQKAKKDVAMRFNVDKMIHQTDEFLRQTFKQNLT